MEWHQGELFHRVGFIVTNLSAKPEGVVRFFNGRGTASSLEIKESAGGFGEEVFEQPLIRMVQ